MNIKDKIRLLPHNPGVYRFLDKSGKVIYVGKAKDLKKRVLSYFHSSNSHNLKTKVLVSHIADLAHTVVDSEEDAFLLENNLIKKFSPKYNILLKDSKSYPWVCIRNEMFPRVIVTRNRKEKGKYYGPYSSAYHAYKLIELINHLYKLRTCKFNFTQDNINAGKYKVCLNYHMGRCKAPCIGEINQEEYDIQIKEVTEILKGNSGFLLREFDEKMKSASEEMNFEKAQIFKERKELLEEHYSKSLIIRDSGVSELDVFTMVIDNKDIFGNYLGVRHSAIVSSINQSMKMGLNETESDIMNFFMLEIYDKLREYEADMSKAKEIIVSIIPSHVPNNVKVSVPTRGEKLALLKLSKKNALDLKYEKLKQEAFVNPHEHSERILKNIQTDLKLDTLPVHIECFDNSNTQGTFPVASCVVFKNAVPSKKDYRHFNIKTVVGPDDFASMKEVVFRRYNRLLKEDLSLPNLIIVDGGKGQVHSAYEALEELNLLDRIPLIGIAKRLEAIIIPGETEPLVLDKNSTTLKIIMQLRDEAHRFGITHHRKKRNKAQFASSLDNIPGIGEKTQIKLLEKYKTISIIKKASLEDLSNLIGKSKSNILKKYLEKK
ncbi:MAG: excinuclease ABC subunit UvrC [Bacteroidales bacterium]